MSAAQNVTGQFNLTSNITQIVNTGIVGQGAGTGSLSGSSLLTMALQWVNATGVALGVDQIYSKQVTIAATTQLFDFAAGSLPDIFGNTIAMLRIRLLAVQVVDPTAGHDMKIEAAATHGILWLPPIATPTFARANGGVVLWLDPNTFGAAAGNFITTTTGVMELDAGANTVTANVVCLGCSVA